MKKGKFIVLYGINNLGKTTQAKLLVEKLFFEGYQASHLKYPVYDLEPTGKMLDEFLREGNPHRLKGKAVQILYAYNRMQYEGELKSRLESGINIVAEDYWGTGVAWGMGYGIDKDFLLRINKPFMWEDVAFWFDGKRFAGSIEKNHTHESDDELTEKVRLAHKELAGEFGWLKVDANDSIETIHRFIFEKVKTVL